MATDIIPRTLNKLTGLTAEFNKNVKNKKNTIAVIGLMI